MFIGLTSSLGISCETEKWIDINQPQQFIIDLGCSKASEILQKVIIIRIDNLRNGISASWNLIEVM